ncbi:MAG: hypothetical protein FD123_3093 [Bacteroidetes bacterium]|nr:MAG: hypothetical protein FD123_3093 [Bacteroidota bacterium]
MKKSTLVLLTIITSVIIFSAFKPATDVKVVAIVNKADWCSICKNYAGRTVATFTENNTDGYFQFIVNDITSEETKRTSRPAIVKAGLEKTLDGSLAAGVLSFYHAKTKKLIAQVTVANTPEEIAATMKMVREKSAE